MLLTAYGEFQARGTVNSPVAVTGSDSSPGLVGCFQLTSRVTLYDAIWDLETLTPASCVSYCHERSFTFAYLANGAQCLCSNGLDQAAQRPGCGTKCSGNHELLCGGGSGLHHVYRTGHRHHFGGLRFPAYSRGRKGLSSLVNVVVSHAGAGDQRDIKDAVWIEAHLPHMENVTVQWSSGGGVRGVGHDSMSQPDEGWEITGLSVFHTRGSAILFDGASCAAGCALQRTVVRHAFGHGVSVAGFKAGHVVFNGLEVTAAARTCCGYVPVTLTASGHAQPG